MNSIRIAFVVTALLCVQNIFAQSKEKKEPIEKQTSGDNFMDLQSKVITNLFGSDLNGNPDGQSIGFLELLENMELTPEQKLEYKNLYYLQAKELTPKQKDSLSAALEKRIREAQRNEQ